MAPDLNSVPPSPRQNVTSNPSSTQPAPSSLSRQSSTPASRRASQIYPMSPPPLPLASPGSNIPTTALPTSQHNQAMPPLSPSISGHVASVDSTGTPMRHPRPMTAAELHLELEKEQEAVVNRLTRELSALRAHSASVASTTSISSSAASGAFHDGNVDPTSIQHATAYPGSIHPTSSRRHRSSSSVSRTGLPPGSYPHRYSVSSQAPSDYTSAQQRDNRSSSIVSTPRYEEVAQQKAELEEVKKENEKLKQRIRDLERLIRQGGDPDTQRGRPGAPGAASSDPRPDLIEHGTENASTIGEAGASTTQDS